MTESAQEELPQIPLISWLAATTNIPTPPTQLKVCGGCEEDDKEESKERKETTPIPCIYHDILFRQNKMGLDEMGINRCESVMH